MNTVQAMADMMVEGESIVQMAISFGWLKKSELKAWLKFNGLKATTDFDANLSTARLALRGVALISGVPSDKMNGWIWEVEQGLMSRADWNAREQARRIANDAVRGLIGSVTVSEVLTREAMKHIEPSVAAELARVAFAKMRSAREAQDNYAVSGANETLRESWESIGNQWERVFTNAYERSAAAAA